MRNILTQGFGRRRGAAVLAAAAIGGAAGAAGFQVAAAARAADRAEERLPGGRVGGHLVVDWSLAAYQAIRAENGYRDPLAASRTLAMMHLAMHDAVNAAAPRHATYLPAADGAGADPGVAAAAAAHGVLLAFCPGQRAALDLTLSNTTVEAGSGAEVGHGLALGAQAARAILAARADDGAGARARYAPLRHVGAYRYTPGFDFVLAPHWRHLRPFALRSPDQFRVTAPPSAESAAYARAFDEVKTLGGRVSTTRTEEQTRIAHVWHEATDIGWNRVTRRVSRERGLDLWDAARLFALVNMALADGYVAGWDSKLQHDSWRPVTAIRIAAEDFNPATIANPAWEPLLPTPPIQGHPSTHSALGAAAAAVLAGLLGDATPFALSSTTALPENPVRRFPGFSAAAGENAESRIMAGLQFRFAVTDGLAMGERIGRFVLANHLRPLGQTV